MCPVQSVTYVSGRAFDLPCAGKSGRGDSAFSQEKALTIIHNKPH
jgi:hypothetical protein